MLIVIILFILYLLNTIGYIICISYNNEIVYFKWKYIPFIWIFLFKYERTYTSKQIKELFYHHKEKYMWYRNIQITKKELDLFIEENL